MGISTSVQQHVHPRAYITTVVFVSAKEIMFSRVSVCVSVNRITKNIFFMAFYGKVDIIHGPIE